MRDGLKGTLVFTNFQKAIIKQKLSHKIYLHQLSVKKTSSTV